MKLIEINLTNEGANNIVTSMLMMQGFSNNLRIIPTFIICAITGYYVMDYDKNGLLVTRLLRLSDYLDLLKQYYSYYDYKISHINYYKSKDSDNVFYTVNLYPLDYDQMVLKKRGS